MYDRPHQRAGWLLIMALAGAMGIASVVARADDGSSSPGLPRPAANLPSPEAPAESADSADDAADAPADSEQMPLPDVPEQERQPLPTPTGPLGGEREPAGESEGWVLQTLTALAIVIAMIYGLRAVLMRMSGTQVGVGGQRLVEVLARTTIGHKTQVVFLKIHQRVIVAVQTPAGMDTLTTMDDPEEVAWLLGEVEAAKPMSITQSFRHVMQRFDKDFGGDPAELGGQQGTGGEQTEQYVDRTRDELSSLLSRLRHLKDRSER